MILLGLLLSAQAAAAAPARPPETIVVTGTRRGKCLMRLADRALSDRQFEAHVGEWARLGRAIRVVHPALTDHLCLARIAFRLHDRGVRVFHFVEQPGAAAGRARSGVAERRSQ